MIRNRIIQFFHESIFIANIIRDAILNKMISPKIFFASFFSAALITASAVGAGSSAEERKMNGYTAAQFGDFTKDWKLVTVRFRRDTNEMRWTYANDAAWKTLEANKIDFPDGAVFAKVGVMTKDDISFPSSAVPSGARRVQFMVRDKRKHADTDGWGYALFDADGKVFPGDQKEATVACAACHRLVPERGFVFSQIASASPAGLSQAPSWKSHLKFLKTKLASLPKPLKDSLKGNFQSVQVISGELSKNLFPGTLDEIRPLLAQEVARSGAPAALVESSGSRFSLVYPLSEKGECGPGQLRLRGVHTVAENPSGLYEVSFCQAEAK